MLDAAPREWPREKPTAVGVNPMVKKAGCSPSDNVERDCGAAKQCGTRCLKFEGGRGGATSRQRDWGGAERLRETFRHIAPGVVLIARFSILAPTSTPAQVDTGHGWSCAQLGKELPHPGGRAQAA